MKTRLQLKRITKRYPAVVANDEVDLRVLPGEIHAVLGENGAGKSTLMKIIYGVSRPDSGQIFWNDAQIDIANPAQARQLGIGIVFQHFSLFDTLTVAENIALGLPKDMRLDVLEGRIADRSEEHTSELPSLMRISTVVF